MSELGRNGITLTAVSDACSVVFSPSSCVVHADFDGSNPVLTYAYTDINVVRGDVKLAIATSNITITSRSNNNITYSLTAIDTYTVRLQITAIPTTILNGSLGVKVTLGAFEILSSFPFTVVRESSMLDWIQDWDGRRTSIGGASIVTPKIFSGSKDSDNSLTGVYLGPDTAGAGIYGYKAVPDPSNTGHTITSEVFHINSNGASIGGWNIETGGISTVDSVSGYSLQLLSSGSIIAKDDNDATIYALYRSGEASFAKGNVLFHADGSAKFVGEIQAGSGKIGNWLISENAIHKAHVVLDSNVSAIMILAADNYQNTANAYTAALKMYGGVKMYYTSSGDYGMEAWLPATEETVGDAVVTQYHQAFALGSSNFIAGWHFDDEKLYGTYAMIVGTNGNAGLYVSSSDISNVAISGLTASIAAGTGIYITAHSNFHELAGYSGGNLVFRLGTNGNKIAGWDFSSGMIYTGSGTTLTTDGFTANNSTVIIATDALRGYKWLLNANGSGKLAGGKISWSADGSGSIASGKIEWDASGNLTFLGGTVKSGSGNNPAWALNPDGSGSLSSGVIYWDSSGNLTLGGAFVMSSNGCIQLSNAGICSEGTAATSVRFWAGSTHANRGLDVGSTNGPKFKVTQGGTVYASDIQVSGGTIGGFSVSGESWINSGFGNDASIILRNDTHGTFVGIGGNVMPAAAGIRAVARFENEDTTGAWGGYNYSDNYGIIVSAKNGGDNFAAVFNASGGTRNFAFTGTGNGVLNGSVVGYGSQEITRCTAANTFYSGDTITSTMIFVKATNATAKLVLPTKSIIANLLNINSTTPFHITLTYLCSIGSSYYEIELYGRNNVTISGSTPYSGEAYPQLYRELIETNQSAINSGYYPQFTEAGIASVQLSKRIPRIIDLYFDGTNYWGVIRHYGLPKYTDYYTGD